MDTALQSPAGVIINLDALESNYRYLCKHTGMTLMPVIKADAYGHGIVPCAQRLAAAGAGWFAVGTVAEAGLLRENGIGQRLVSLLGCLTAADIDLAINRKVIPFVGSFEQLAAISARSGNNQVKVALKFNTGMNRLGFSLSEMGELIQWLAQHPGVEPELAASHLASADENGGIEQTDNQIKTFKIIAEELRRNYPLIKTSLYNSAGLLAHAHKFKTDLARPGLALYGSNPLAGTDLNQPGTDTALKPVMQVWAPLVQKRLLRKGEGISYGATFIAPDDIHVAIVAVGYAQGFSRGLSGKAELNIRGVRCPVLGRVCMQLVAVNINDVPEAAEGERVWILGGPGARPISAAELSAWWGSIPYEVFCLLGSVNAREYS